MYKNTVITEHSYACLYILFFLQVAKKKSQLGENSPKKIRAKKNARKKIRAAITSEKKKSCKQTATFYLKFLYKCFIYKIFYCKRCLKSLMHVSFNIILYLF